MADFTKFAEASRAVSDPSTSGADLAQIAQSQPGLGPQVASHPNVYPGLLNWLDKHGDAATKQAVLAEVARRRGTSSATSAVPQPGAGTTPVSPNVADPMAVARPVPESTPWAKTSKGMWVLIGSIVGVLILVLALVLVMTMIVGPNRRAAAAAAAAASASAASASAEAEQEYRSAVTAFNTASAACNTANQSMTSEIATARKYATTDPSTMQDPTLITTLNQSLTTAQAVKLCMPPTMASDTASIQQQTTALQSDSDAVTKAVSDLKQADAAVPASVKAKQQAIAAALPAGVVAFEGHSYLVYTSGADTWDQASAICQSISSGYLAHISSADENNFLYQYITSQGVQTAYFGFTNVTQDGTYQWSDGQPDTYTNWHPGEPNNATGHEHWAEFYWKNTDGTWNDGDFGSGTEGDARDFICEWNMAASN
ncbi:MAG: C-type lectin domain-containing protein [Propionibacteriaceae bacterium]|nr:C-type lectin domain-containing protein [Propionibacteriaceae bacterium]